MLVVKKQTVPQIHLSKFKASEYKLPMEPQVCIHSIFLNSYFDPLAENTAISSDIRCY